MFADDPVNKVSSETKYYVMGDKVSGSYKNNTDNAAPISPDNLAKNDDRYYAENYGTNDNVEPHAVPSYWQAVLPSESDANKQFCRYFILKVTWDPTVQATNVTKETDMIYFSVKRKD